LGRCLLAKTKLKGAVGHPKSVDTLEGGKRPHLFGIIEFADRQTALDFWNDDDYRETTRLRQEVGTYDIFLVDGDAGRLS
jgi:uncharacterized protein (DUF1330 family)